MTKTITGADLWTMGTELDDIAFRFRAASRLVYLAQTAYIDGASRPERVDYEALYPVYEQLETLCGELDNLARYLTEERVNSAAQDGAAAVLYALQEAYKAGREGRPPLFAPPPASSAPDVLQIFQDATRAMYLRGREQAEINRAKV